MILRLFVFAALGLPVSAALAQECTSGPACAAADANAKAQIQTWSSALAGPSDHVSATVSYCTNSKIAEVARICAEEFNAAGKSACAEIASQQAYASAQTAIGALSAAKQTAATHNWSPNCADVASGDRADFAGAWTLSIGSMTRALQSNATGQASFSITSSRTIGKESTSFTSSIQGTITKDTVNLSITTSNYSNPKFEPGSPVICSGRATGRNTYSGSCVSPQNSSPFKLSKN